MVITNKRLNAVGWTALSAVGVALFVAFVRRNRDVIASIPGVGDLSEYIFQAPVFNMRAPNIDIPSIPEMDFSLFKPTPRGPNNYPITNTCGCGGGTRVEIVQNLSAPVDLATLAMASQFEYEPPPLRRVYPNLEEVAKTQFAQAVFKRHGKARGRLRNLGYEYSPLGMMHYGRDTGCIREVGMKWIWDAGCGVHNSWRMNFPNDDKYYIME